MPLLPPHFFSPTGALLIQLMSMKPLIDIWLVRTGSVLPGMVIGYWRLPKSTKRKDCKLYAPAGPSLVYIIQSTVALCWPRTHNRTRQWRRLVAGPVLFSG